MARNVAALRLSSEYDRPTGPQAAPETPERPAGFSRLEGAVLPRPHKVCDSEKPICPHCNKPLRRIQPVLGSLLARCDNRHPTRRGEKCGAHVHVLGAPEGICIVALVSKEEFERAAAEGVRTAKLYREIGVFAPAGT